VDIPLEQFVTIYLVVEALSKFLSEVRRSMEIRGIKFFDKESISHLLFVDDVLCFTKGCYRDLSTLKRVFELFCKANEMEINSQKCRMLTSPLSTHDI
jgi:hypothetical protein